MSQETSQWLNGGNILIGNVATRGRNAWWYKPALDDPNESTHYQGPIPVADVKRRLFHWQAVDAKIMASGMGPDGPVFNADNEWKAILRSDTADLLGCFKSGYLIHQFDEWLVDQVALILDADLGIGSAGLLKGGAVAWVQVEVPDNITTPEGVVFRPHLLATTSHDGSLATQFKRTITNVVCDNTMAAGLAEAGAEFRVRHSKYSDLKLLEARAALELVHTTADDFKAEVAELCNVTVSEGDWEQFLESLIPTDKPDMGKVATRNAMQRHDDLQTLWNGDVRVKPWKNTAWGVVQAVNTATHHVWGNQQDRAERNMLRTVTGNATRLDSDTLAALNGVLAHA